MKIEGAGALVTGAASGLGAAVARMLAARGAAVTIFDRNGEAGQKLATEIGATAIQGDVASDADAQLAVNAAACAKGGLRILVNCAGVGTAGRILGREGPQPLGD